MDDILFGNHIFLPREGDLFVEPKLVTQILRFVTRYRWNDKLKSQIKLNVDDIIKCFSKNQIINNNYFVNNTRKQFVMLLKHECNIKTGTSILLWNDVICFYKHGYVDDGLELPVNW
eukprot:542035_1